MKKCRIIRATSRFKKKSLSKITLKPINSFNKSIEENEEINQKEQKQKIPESSKIENSEKNKENLKNEFLEKLKQQGNKNLNVKLFRKSLKFPKKQF